MVLRAYQPLASPLLAGYIVEAAVSICCERIE
jgi:hypothetical protein